MAKKKLSRIGSLRDKINSNDARAKRGSGFTYLVFPDGVEEFKPEPETKYVVDFLMYQVAMKNHPDRDDKNENAVPESYWYKLPLKIHRDVGVRNEKVICPSTFGKPCPICELRNKLRKEDGDEDEIKALGTSDRNLYVIKIRNNKKLKADFYLYDASDFKFQDVFRKQLKDDDRWYSFMHPTEGCSVKITFDEANFAGNKYAEATRFDFVERDEQYEDEILDEVPVLDECITVLSYDQLKAKFFEATEEEDDEEDEKPKHKQAAPAKKPTRKPEPEPEPEDEDEDEEEEETSLTDEINAAADVDELMDIAKSQSIFKTHLKTLKTITKTKLLKNEMLAIVGGEDEEEEEEEEEKPAPKKKAVEEPAPARRRKPEPEPEEDDDEEEEEPAPKKKQAAAPESGKCPSGHKFGKDNDEYDECDDCPVWNACYKKSKEK